MLLLDTQVVIWLALEPARVPKAFIRAMLAARKAGGLSIASISLWEIAQLTAKGKLQIDRLDAFLQDVERAYTVLPLSSEIAIRGCQFSKKFPKDPADRQIAATAIVHGLTLLTADKQILKSEEAPCFT